MMIGGFRFSWQGAIIGFFVGYCIEEVLVGNFDIRPEKVFKKEERISFSQHQLRLLILVSSILNTERKIDSKKLRFATKYFYRQFGTRYGDEMRIQLKDFLKFNYDYIPIAKDLKAAFEKKGRINVLKFLYELSISDGDLTTREKNILQSMAGYMGLSKMEYEELILGYRKKANKTSSFFQYSTLDYAYRSLGVDKDISDQELKKIYRKLILKYHPDRTKLNVEIATQKFNEVSKAYDKIKEARGIK